MNPMIGTYCYGSERSPREGLRIGVAPFAPRGVRRENRQHCGSYDLWVPLLAPDPGLFRKFRRQEIAFANFARLYRNGMKRQESRQVIDLIAAVASILPVSIGCVCEDEASCHRSLLKQLIREAAEEKRAVIDRLTEPGSGTDPVRFSSPVCFANWDESDEDR